MLGKLVTMVVVFGAAYWYWTGPYQAAAQPDYQQRLQQHAEDMDGCVRGKNYAAGATGEVSGDPEEMCALRFNLYRHEGQWHSYDEVRPES